jgi:hypothetical protein
MIKSRRMKWMGHVTQMGEKRNACRILVGKPHRKRPLGRSRVRWVNNIKTDLGNIKWGGGVLTGLVWFGIRTSGGLL